ncbi:cytochrome P450 [Mycobacterium sp. ACS4331]|uniref:cytochrome P450 n=1 Tax=Mycobacterium sp. ACS4331 TaxID=1834121 RepID=UPI00080136DC|nr:cytochrome P450 [Mycobacterium sp. ACS4331]OBF20664.1 cytochrome [Mycobacterium sp. ACS4331]
MPVLDDPMTLFGAAGVRDPYPLFDQMRAEAPLHRIGDSGFYAVCSWDAVVEAITRVDDFSSNLTAVMVFGDGGEVTPFPMGELDGPIHALATADDPVHAVHRRILLPHLSAKRVQVISEYAQRTARQLIADGLSDGTIDWMGGVANRLPMMVVTRLLGLPEDDVDKLVDLGYRAASLLDGIGTAEHMESAGMAAMELSGYVLEHFHAAADAPTPGLIGDLASRCAGGEIEEMTALTMMITLFSAAGESTASLLGSAAWILATRPAVQRQLRDDPNLLGAFVEEALRYEAPFRGHYRHVRHDTALAGVDLPAGSRLLLMWGAANRDARQFDAPNDFRLDRASAKGHITFGKGAHFCVGAALARLEARIVLGELLAGTSWIEADEVGDWVPSVLVRRLEGLRLRVQD